MRLRIFLEQTALKLYEKDTIDVIVDASHNPLLDEIHTGLAQV